MALCFDFTSIVVFYPDLIITYTELWFKQFHGNRFRSEHSYNGLLWFNLGNKWDHTIRSLGALHNQYNNIMALYCDFSRLIILSCNFNSFVVFHYDSTNLIVGSIISAINSHFFMMAAILLIYSSLLIVSRCYIMIPVVKEFNTLISALS